MKLDHKRLNILLGCCLLSMFIGMATVKATADRLYVGVLETKHVAWPDESPHFSEKTGTKKVVRVLFYKDRDNWRSLKHDIINSKLYPSKVNWFIAFDGKNIGSFRSSFVPLRYPDVDWAPRDAHHLPSNATNLPTIGKPTSEFSGWDNYKSYRPLVVVSAANCTDPERWKPFKPNNRLVNLVKKDFLDYLKHKLLVSDFQNTKVVALKSYRSNKNEVLLQVGLKEYVDYYKKYLISYAV